MSSFEIAQFKLKRIASDMKRKEFKWIIGAALFALIIGYSCFGEIDVITAKGLSGLGLLVGLGLMGEHHSSQQKQ